MQDLSSPTRNQTHPSLQRKCRFLTTGSPGKSLSWTDLYHSSLVLQFWIADCGAFFVSINMEPIPILNLSCVCVCVCTHGTSVMAQMAKNPPAMQETRLERMVTYSRREENGYLFQNSFLEITLDRGSWWATVHRIAKSQMWLSN